MNQEQLGEVYKMVDSIPFSRSKKNISRDFSDGVMMAELISHYNPKLISFHNYPAANSVAKKIDNWNTLNNKVFRNEKLKINLTRQQIQDIVYCAPNAIEQLLYIILNRFEQPDTEVRLTDNALSLNKPKKSAKNNEQISNEKPSPKVFQNFNDKESPRAHQKQSELPEEIFDLVTRIDQAHAHLQSLQEVSRLKEQKIRTLEKKLEKIIFT